MYIQSDFRVIRILDEFSVVIDGGYNNGVKNGDLFQIYVPGETITDPENPEIELGSLDTVKATITASEVNPGITVCKNAELANILGNKVSDELQTLFKSIYPSTRPLKIEPTQVNPVVFSSDLTIKVGDAVRKLPSVQSKP